MTTEEIDAEVNPPAAKLVAETEDLCRHGEWAEGLANLKRMLRRNIQEPGGYTPAQTYHAMADCAMNLGYASQAITYYREALRFDPTLRMAQENLIFLLDAQAWSSDGQAKHARAQWWKHIGEPAYAQRQPHANVPDPEKRLRVGYVSSDFRFHSALISCQSVLTKHTAQIEPVFYSTLREEGYDHVTKDFKAGFGHAFVDVSKYHPKDLADIVRADKIDILVDLSGYTAGNRLLTFAYKPAPIQITAWGYATGAGWKAMDVLFADPIVATPSMRRSLPERVVDLPCVIGFQPRPDLPEPNPLPCLGTVSDEGALIPRGPVFGVFQRAMKCNEDTLQTWTQILKRVPESRILFKGQDYTPLVRGWIVDHMKGMQSQIDFVQGTSHKDQQLWYQGVDLSLDPWPQTGGVSTMESLNMGVPCVTLLGERVIQRTSASILTTLGMPDFIATTKKDYIRKAVEWTTTRKEELNTIRLGLRSRLMASPIINGYVDAAETAYRTLWREWCAQQQTQENVA